MTERWQVYVRLMRLDRPIGTLLLLWPTVWALLIAAQGWPDGKVLLVFLAGVLVMRSAGCVINDIADRNFDGHVSRTHQRPLATGEATVREALGLFAVLILIAFMLVLSLDWQTILLSPVALLLAAVYPLMKRITYLPQVVLGAAFSWAIPMAFMAQCGAIPEVAWWLFAANVLWTVAYDTLYAVVDRADDEKIGVKSTARLFGRLTLPMVAMLQLGTVLALMRVGWLEGFCWLYWLGLAMVTALFGYQLQLARQSVAGCFTAFLHNNRVGALLALMIASQYLS